MSQRLIIRLIPIEIFAFCLLAGWLAISGVRALITGSSAVRSSRRATQCLASGQMPQTGFVGAQTRAPSSISDWLRTLGGIAESAVTRRVAVDQ